MAPSTTPESIADEPGVTLPPLDEEVVPFVYTTDNRGDGPIYLTLMPSGHAVPLTREKARQLVKAIQGLLGRPVPSKTGETHKPG